MAEQIDARADSAEFRLDIQGLRAIAVGAVVLYHAGVPFLPGGYVGVDVFFVISGFLITTHLLKGLRAEGRIRFGTFYARRARRILPASFVVLALSLVAALIWYPPLLMRDVWAGAVATALYVPNYFFAIADTDYLAASTTPSLFQHYWSLGVEEQFYLVWPALLALAWFAVRSRRALLAVLVVVVASSFAACVWLTTVSQPWAFFSLPTRAWELGVGGLVAFALTHRPHLVSSRVAPALGWLGIAAIAASVVLFTHHTPFPGAWAALPVLGTAAAIVAGSTPAARGPARMLSARGMVFIGTISYSLYLVHWPALVIPHATVRGPLPLWASLLIAVLCVPAAWALYRFVENPMRRAPWLTRARTRRTLIGAAIGSAGCLVLATGAYAVSDIRPLSVPQDAPPAAVTDPPPVTDFVPENLKPALRDARESLPVIYPDGCNKGKVVWDDEHCLYGDADAPRIVLFGDSHAAHWFPALEKYADKAGYAVEVHTKAFCPAASIETVRNDSPYPECPAWRDAVIEKINAEHPALVLLASYGGGALAPDVRNDFATWDEALGKTLDALKAPTAVMADTPDMMVDPAPCLSVHLTDAEACGEARDVALGGPAREAEVAATQARGIPLIDLNDYLCDEKWCPPIIGNTLLYRDSHHLTAAFSAELSGVLGDALAPLLAAARTDPSQ